MSPTRNANETDVLARPLSPRSVIASLLLGMHPPRLRGALLVRWCAHLGIAQGTTRVALSRMVDAGELIAVDGRYELAGPLRTRQAGQDWSLAPVLLPWDGTWTLWIVHPGRRPAPRRAELRHAASAGRLVELRDGAWGRPDNLPREATSSAATAILEAQASRWTARPTPRDEPDVVELFGLAATADRMVRLLAQLGPLTAELRAGDLSRLGPGFALGAATLQQIRRDPLLPASLAGDGWPGAALRSAYGGYQRAFSEAVRAWFTTASP